jgi:nitrogen fixation protein FixH
MTRINRLAFSVFVAGMCFLAGGCERSPQPSVQSATVTGDSTIAIDFRSDPNPPTSGKNTVEVSLKGADGAPLTDASVTAVFYMPAMPSMSMPEMRSTFVLEPQSAGLYRGTGDLVMAGTWNVTVNVARDGNKVASSKFTVIAK